MQGTDTPTAKLDERDAEHLAGGLIRAKLEASPAPAPTPHSADSIVRRQDASLILGQVREVVVECDEVVHTKSECRRRMYGVVAGQAVAAHQVGHETSQILDRHRAPVEAAQYLVPSFERLVHQAAGATTYPPVATGAALETGSRVAP